LLYEEEYFFSIKITVGNQSIINGAIIAPTTELKTDAASEPEACKFIAK
jgi:hypothetical protein